MPKSTVTKLIKDEPVLTQRWMQKQAKKPHVGHRKRKRDGKRLCQSEDGSEDKDSDTDEEVAKTTYAAARRSVQLLQQYFVEQGVSDAYHAAIDYHRRVCGRSLSMGKC